VFRRSCSEDADDSHKLKKLPNDVFFGFNFLMELDLSNNNLKYIPLSISQCFLLERINISGNKMKQPPLVLFSLPKIRNKPENLVFGQHVQCTRVIMEESLALSSIYNSVLLTFIEHDRSLRKVSLSPDTTLYEMVVLLHPEYIDICPFLFLVRSYKGNDLYLKPENLPILLFDIPNATWSIELRFVPPILTPSLFPLLRHYVIQQMLVSPNHPDLIKCLNLIPCDNEYNKIDIQSITEAVKSSEIMSSRRFVIELDNGDKIDIGVNMNSVFVKSFESKHPIEYTYKDVQFVSSNNKLYLIFDKNALPLKQETASNILPFLSIIFENENPTYNSIDDKIYQTVAKANEMLIKSQIPMGKALNLDNSKLKSQLNDLRNFKASHINYSPKIVSKHAF